MNPQDIQQIVRDLDQAKQAARAFAEGSVGQFRQVQTAMSNLAQVTGDPLGSVRTSWEEAGQEAGKAAGDTLDVRARVERETAAAVLAEREKNQRGQDAHHETAIKVPQTLADRKGGTSESAGPQLAQVDKETGTEARIERRIAAARRCEAEMLRAGYGPNQMRKQMSKGGRELLAVDDLRRHAQGTANAKDQNQNELENANAAAPPRQEPNGQISTPVQGRPGSGEGGGKGGIPAPLPPAGEPAGLRPPPAAPGISIGCLQELAKQTHLLEQIARAEGVL